MFATYEGVQSHGGVLFTLEPLLIYGYIDTFTFDYYSTYT